MINRFLGAGNSTQQNLKVVSIKHGGNKILRIRVDKSSYGVGPQKHIRKSNITLIKENILANYGMSSVIRCLFKLTTGKIRFFG